MNLCDRRHPQAPIHPRAFAILTRTGGASAISQAFSCFQLCNMIDSEKLLLFALEAVRPHQVEALIDIAEKEGQ